MSQMKRFDRSLYPCIQDAIGEILDSHLLVDGEQCIYGARALDEVCFFLAENDIQHSYMVIPAPDKSLFDEVVSVVWCEGNYAGNEIWYSRGKTCTKKLHKLTIVVAANDVEDIESWLSDADMNDIELIDYEREELMS